MCGHGTIGIVHTLAYLGRIGPGAHRIETPVGTVTARLGSDGRVAVDNVASARIAAQVALDVPGYGRMRGDVAWGGNWFFLVDQGEHKQTLDIKNAGALTACADQIRTALTQAGIRGAGGAEIDHIELFGPPSQPGADSRSFVLCPGSAYDRSPCGTGTSAKLACLAADGKLAEGRVWRQESITGSVFEAAYARVDGEIRPTITGRAHITADARLIVDPKDPFRDGIAAR
jgi:proline racemase